MHFTRIAEMVKHAPRRLMRECLYHYDLARLWLYNRVGRGSVTSNGNVVVSMTTWSKRISTAYLAIESIAAGHLRPSRFILWIDEEELLANLPAPLRRLQRRGLEIRHCRNYGPHKKYYPYVESQRDFAIPLVTADDDWIFPRDWLKKLMDANRQYPNFLNCWLTKLVQFDKDGLRPFSEWSRFGTEQLSFRNHPQGGAGCICPPALLRALKEEGTEFETCCPKADDLWLHAVAIRAGIRIRQVHPRPPYLTFQRIVPGTQEDALYQTNIIEGGNDSAGQLTYSQTDIDAMRADALATTH